MRASPGTQQNLIADTVWDETRASHIAGGSMGATITLMQDMGNKYTRRTAYTFGPTEIASGAYFTPVGGTLITIITCELNNVLELFHGSMEILAVPAGALHGFGVTIYCDGINVKFKNTAGTGEDVSAEGITI